MLSEDGSVEIGFGLVVAFTGIIAPLFKGGMVWQNLGDLCLETIFVVDVALAGLGEALKEKRSFGTLK